MEPPPPSSSRLLWVSHSPSASGWSDTQGCDPPARGLPGALCRPAPPREGSSPAELPTHPRAASRVSKEPAAPRPRPLQPPSARVSTPAPGTFVSRGGLSASSPPAAPRGHQPPRKPRSAANSGGSDGSPSPQDPQPAPHSRSPRRARTCDRQDPYPSRPLTGVTIPVRPRHQLTSKCGDRGLRAGAQSERMQVRWRRTRRGASGSGLPPRAFRSARAAGRLTRG